ncbi:hypothetical protein D3C81_1906200 [compost metagenome]
MDLLVGEGVIDSNGHAFGNLAQQLEIGGSEDFFFALGQLEDAKHRVAGHQRQQTQGL